MEEDRGLSLIETTDHSYIVTGYTKSYGVYGFYRKNVWLIGTDTQGALQWMQLYGANGDDGAYSVTETNDHGFLMAGYTDSFGDDSQAWLIKTDSLGTSPANYYLSINPKGESYQPISLVLSTFPNPTNLNCTIFYSLPRTDNIMITIHDLLGAKIFSHATGELSAGQQFYTWSLVSNDGEDLPTGIYLLQLNGKYHRGSSKILLIK